MDNENIKNLFLRYKMDEERKKIIASRLNNIKLPDRLAPAAISFTLALSLMTGCGTVNKPTSETYVIEYEVQSGDTLTKISDFYGIPLQNIIDENNISDPNEIVVGQILNVPLEIELIEVVVKEGDTLTEIAEKNDTTIDCILLANEIENPNVIEVDQVLLVPRGLKYISPESIEILKKLLNFCGKIIEETSEKYNIDSYHNENNYAIGNVNLGQWDRKLASQGYVKGIDISNWQTKNEPNFNLQTILENNDIDFIMLRSYVFLADREIDSKFDEYCQIAKDNGVAIGTYFWPTLKNVETTIEEVDILIEKLKENEEKGISYTMPIFIDIETMENGGGNVTTRLRDNDPDTIASFNYLVDYIREQGYEVMLYVNKEVGEKYGLFKLAEEKKLKIWYAGGHCYNSNISINGNFSDYISAAPVSSCVGRQITQYGKVEGYDGPIDINAWLVNTPKELYESGYNHLKELNIPNRKI